MVAWPILSRVTSGRAPVLNIRLECIVRKLRKSMFLGSPSANTVGLICRFNRLCRSMGLPARLANTRSSGLSNLAIWRHRSCVRFHVVELPVIYALCNHEPIVENALPAERQYLSYPERCEDDQRDD